MKHVVIQKDNGILIVKSEGDDQVCGFFIPFEEMKFEEIKMDYSCLSSGGFVDTCFFSSVNTTEWR